MPSTIKPHAVLWICLALAIANLIRLAAFGALSADELQMLNVAWAMNQGEGLYTQIWDNHGAWYNIALAGLLRLTGANSFAAFVVVGRLAHAALLCAASVLCYLTVPRIVPNRSLMPALALLAFLVSPAVLATGYEIRADVPALFLFALTFYCWWRGWAGGRLTWFLAGGIAIGLMLGFSIKVLLVGVAMGALFLSWLVLQRAWKQVFSATAIYGIGAAIGFAIVLLTLHQAELLSDWYAGNVGQNFDRGRPAWSAGLAYVLRGQAHYCVLFAGACVVALRALILRRLPVGIGVLLPCAMVLVLQFLFLLPTHFWQSLLMAALAGSILMAWSGGEVAAWCLSRLPASFGASARATLPSALILAFLVDGLPHKPNKRDSLADQFRRNGVLSAVIAPTEFVLSGFGEPVDRPKPFPYKAFVITLRDRLAAGQIALDFPAELDRLDVRYIVMDSRLADLPRPLLEFQKENYIPGKAYSLLAAGQVLDAEADSPTSFTVRVAGTYYARVLGESDARISINGSPIEGASSVELRDGPHTLVASRNTQVLVTILSPAEMPDSRQLDRYITSEVPPDGKSLPKKVYNAWWNE